MPSTVERNVTIQTVTILKNGARRLSASNGGSYMIAAKNSAFSVAENVAYDIEYAVQTSTYRGNPQETFWVNSIQPCGDQIYVHINQDAPKSPGNGLPLPSNPIDRRELSICRQTAEKCAAELTGAYASMLAASGCLQGQKRELIQEWIDSYRKQVFGIVIKEIME